MPAIKNKEQKLRFIAVGICNTLIDFGLLFGLKFLGLPAVPANIISTSAAFGFSFFANRKFTFKTNGDNVKRQLFLFIIVTLFGLWGLQTVVIFTVTSLLKDASLNQELVLFMAKILATIVSLVWNYVLYSRVVFKDKTSQGG